MFYAHTCAHDCTFCTINLSAARHAESKREMGKKYVNTMLLVVSFFAGAFMLNVLRYNILQFSNSE